MSRHKLGSILICALVALAYFVWNGERENLLDAVGREIFPEKYYGTGIAVYARQEIYKGALITKDLIEERQLAINKMPDHIAIRASEVMTSRSDKFSSTIKFNHGGSKCRR